MSTTPANDIRLSRRYRFSASHRLYSDELSETENRAIFGKCANPYGHGHDYVLDVRVRGPLDRETGRIIDLDTLDTLVRETILGPFEHSNLNVDIPEFQSSLVPTTENLALVIEHRLAGEWKSRFASPPLERVKLDRIKIEETRRNIFEVSSSYE
ncbi:MAG TPA: 6-carboxytetrahydropterin synthase [Bryobacteraceae bacterium]|jgi:6-pyruvoyltetrahydropterin/6-carboxytetrahydropterin synthase